MGVRPFFEVRASAIQGLGAFAVRRIRTGTRIIEYQGERITPEEADQRYGDDLPSHPHMLLFSADKHTLIDAGTATMPATSATVVLPTVVEPC